MISTWTNVPKTQKTGRPAILNNAITEKLERFLSDNSISMTLPGRNNQVYTGKDENGESIFASKKYILWIFNELASIIKEEEDEELAQLKFSTLYRHIRSKKEYIINSKIPEVNCLCPTCESIELLCSAVNKSSDLNLPKKCHELVEQIACNPLTEDCAKGTCSKCPVINLDLLTGVDRIPFYHWVKRQQYQKELSELSGSEIKAKLTEMFSTLKTHFFQKRVQSQAYRKHIDELADDEMLVHVDYSENYKNKQPNEIKASFHGQGQFTLYTACLYVKSGEEVVCKSFVLVTTENDHSCNVTFALNNLLIKEALTQKACKIIKFWSDGCASQFRSRYAFFMLTKFNPGINLEWNFFEANHGKGAVDGIGGRVKHSVFRRVLSKQIVIESPKHFAEYANSILPKKEVVFVDEDQMELGYESECREKAVYIPGTPKVHCVRRTIIEKEKCELRFYQTTTSAEVLKTQEYETGSHRHVHRVLEVKR